MENPQTFTAFLGESLLASGAKLDVALSVKAALQTNGLQTILIFEDGTGRQVDFGLRGEDYEIAARLASRADDGGQAKRSGRPKLGVVAREVALLPQHWDWLADQPGGASVTLRKLIDATRKEEGPEAIAQAGEAGSRPFYVGDARQSAGVRRSLACPLWSRSPPLHDFDGGVACRSSRPSRAPCGDRFFGRRVSARCAYRKFETSKCKQQPTSCGAPASPCARTKEGFESARHRCHAPAVRAWPTIPIKVMRDAALRAAPSSARPEASSCPAGLLMSPT